MKSYRRKSHNRTIYSPSGSKKKFSNRRRSFLKQSILNDLNKAIEKGKELAKKGEKMIEKGQELSKKGKDIAKQGKELAKQTKSLIK